MNKNYELLMNKFIGKEIETEKYEKNKTFLVQLDDITKNIKMKIMNK